MGRGPQGLDQAGLATSQASHVHWDSGVSVTNLGALRGPKAKIPSWRNEVESYGCPPPTMLVAM